MIKVRKEQLHLIASLFTGIEDSMVIACLQGYMGDAYVKTWRSPKAALIISGEYSFFGGDPLSEEGKYLAQHLFDVYNGDSSVGIFADQHPQWENTLMECAQNHPKAVARFGIAQKDYVFDMGLLQKYIDSLPAEFQMMPFNEDIYKQAMAEPWSQEFCETFASERDYLERGFGFAALYRGKMVSGASTMTVYDGGTEIQVATEESYRQKGLALPCAAALVKKCAERGIRPCWDAANLISKKMALKLGYEYKGEYTTIHMHP